ncbi:hypothetical protein [Streptomyces monashensis]|uniref:DUF3592 domain-containing protein n=1 Tax=Streptomyces monashensis TaxID=1678012 RepID=A0A1S2Q6Q0_9ACTN|nr:hypothetical protein [Streptomyces monashensis]OIK01216.1 hypothetical protein BIV23_26105 [Streptomyces monashensis]
MLIIQLAYNCHMENCTGFKTDNTPFYFLVGSVVCAVLFVCMAEAVTTLQKRKLLQRGIAAGAEIKKVTSRKVHKDGTVEVGLKLEVTAPDGEVFEAQTDEEFPITELPQIGWSINVRYSAKDRHRVAADGAASPSDGKDSGDSGRP